MASSEDRPNEPYEIQSLNEGILDADELSPEDLEEVAGGVVGCTDFTGTCERFSGSCTGFGPGPVNPPAT